MLFEDGLCAIAEPACMPGFAGHQPIELFAQQREERAHHARFKLHRRRQLHDQRAEPASQSGDLIEELRQWTARRAQTHVMGDLARQLHREAERCRRLPRPVAIGVPRMRAMEG